MTGTGSGEIVVITGTGTGIGKTYGTAALVGQALAAGRRVCVVKPVQTGVTGDRPGDVHEVLALVAPLGRPEIRELLRLPEPMAPQAAARLAGVDLPPLATHVEAVRELATGFDLVLVEGAGGLLVRLDDAGGTLADLARELDAPMVVMTTAELGTLNVTELTVEAAHARGARVLGLVVGRWPQRPDPVQRHNLADLPVLAGVPLLGVVPECAPGAAPALEPVPA